MRHIFKLNKISVLWLALGAMMSLMLPFVAFAQESKTLEEILEEELKTECNNKIVSWARDYPIIIKQLEDIKNAEPSLLVEFNGKVNELFEARTTGLSQYQRTAIHRIFRISIKQQEAFEKAKKLKEMKAKAIADANRAGKDQVPSIVGIIDNKIAAILEPAERQAKTALQNLVRIRSGVTGDNIVADTFMTRFNKETYVSAYMPTEDVATVRGTEKRNYNFGDSPYSFFTREDRTNLRFSDGNGGDFYIVYKKNNGKEAIEIAHQPATGQPRLFADTVVVPNDRDASVKLGNQLAEIESNIESCSADKSPQSVWARLTDENKKKLGELNTTMIERKAKARATAGR